MRGPLLAFAVSLAIGGCGSSGPSQQAIAQKIHDQLQHAVNEANQAVSRANAALKTGPAVTASPAAPVVAARPARVTIACVRAAKPANVVAPADCFMQPGQESLANSSVLRGLHWSAWGAPVATATGGLACTGTGCATLPLTAVHVAAYRIVNGKYTRARITSARGAIVQRLDLPTFHPPPPAASPSLPVVPAAPQPGPPDPALCQSLYDQWIAGGGASGVDQAAIVEYAQIGCDQSARTDGNTWCKTFRSTSTDVPGYPPGQLQRICDFRPGTKGAYPP